MIENISEYYDMLWSQRKKFQSKIIDKNWSKGRMEHLAFLARIEGNAILQKIKKVQDDLSRNICYKPFPTDYMHITVKVLGFLSEKKEHPDDYTSRELADVMERAKDAFSPFDKFTIEIGPVNIVPQCTFAQIQDYGIFAELNKIVLEIPGVMKRESRDYPNFMPHMSMGHFKSRDDFGELIKAIELNYRGFEFGTTILERIDLVIVHLEGNHPVLETIKSYPLK